MSFPQPLSVTESFITSSSTTHNVAMPATVDAGDLLLCILNTRTDTAVTTPSGWVSKGTLAQSTATRLSVYTKDADGTEGGTTVNFATAGSVRHAAQVYRITGWGGDATDDVEAALASGTTSTPDSPSLNPAGWVTEETLWVTAFGARSTTEVSAYPSNYTDGVLTSGAADITNGAVVGSARRENAVESENPSGFTVNATGSSWVAVTIAIRPIPAIPKAFSDAGAEGAESFVKAVQVSKAFSDAGAEGAESFQLAKLKAFSDAGAEGSESFHLTKHKSISDAGAEGTEAFSKTRLINPTYLKNRFEAIIIKILDS